MKEQCFYKVVDHISDGYFSSTISDPLSKEYLVGKFVRANHSMERLGYGLTFFTNLPDAERFFWANKYGISELWKVQVKGIMKRLPPLSYNIIRSYSQSISETIDTYLVGIEKWDTGVWPTGTKMARQIMLVERIK